MARHQQRAVPQVRRESPPCAAPVSPRAWLNVVVAVLFALGVGCGPAGPGNGSGNGGDAGNGFDHGAPGDAGSGAVADLGGAYGVTALVDGVRYTVTEAVFTAGMADGAAFTFVAGNTDFEAYWTVTATLELGPQACGNLVPPFFTAGLPNGGIGHHLSVACTIEVDEYEVEGLEAFGEMTVVTSIRGRFAGTMRQYMVDGSIGYVGPTRVVANGVFHYVAEP